jgi:hypothetical protein
MQILRNNSIRPINNVSLLAVILFSFLTKEHNDRGESYCHIVHRFHMLFFVAVADRDPKITMADTVDTNIEE